MRDALGALGPVDGINPELSNLTISVTTLCKGDIVMVASDGLTDNFDPNVCKFTVNTSESIKTKTPNISKSNFKKESSSQHLVQKQNKQQVVKTECSLTKPPVKPPRRSKNRHQYNRYSAEKSEKCTMPSKDSQEISNFSLSKMTSPNECSINRPTMSILNKHKSEISNISTNCLSDSVDNVQVDINSSLLVQFPTDNSVTDSSKNISKFFYIQSF